MFTCVIRYIIDPTKTKEFIEYAHCWIKLVNKYGGIHHGYFIPGNATELPNSSFSFPGIGHAGPDNIAVALFSFASVEQYETYKKLVTQDAECKAMTARVAANRCFVSYERNFLKPIFSE